MLIKRKPRAKRNTFGKEGDVEGSALFRTAESHQRTLSLGADLRT